MKKALSVLMALAFVLMLSGCSSISENLSQQNEPSGQHVNHTFEDFDYFTIEYIPDGYEGYYYESADLRSEIGLAAYGVEFVKTTDPKSPRLSLLFICDLDTIKVNSGMSEPYGEFAKDSSNGCWAIYQDDYPMYRPQLYLYPTGDNSIGMIEIFVSFDDGSNVSEGEYFDELLQDALVLANGISESSFSMDDYEMRLYGR